MPVLHFDLRDGFNHDDAVLYVNEKEAARASDLTTDLTISHAASLQLEVPDGPFTLRLEVPKQGVSASTTVDAAETPYVAVFILDREVSFHKSKEAMPML
jgi:hypothetical protein